MSPCCNSRLILADADEYGTTYECGYCGEEYYERRMRIGM